MESQTVFKLVFLAFSYKAKQSYNIVSRITRALHFGSRFYSFAFFLCLYQKIINKQTNEAEICLLYLRKTSQELDHLRTIAIFPDETGKYLKNIYTALLIAVLVFKK